MTVAKQEQKQENLDQTSADPAGWQRRSFRRIIVDYPASFDTISGIQAVRVLDISPRGTKLLLTKPVDRRSNGRLLIDAYEVFCGIVWGEGMKCGLAFDHTLPSEAYSLISQSACEVITPIACPQLIPHGRRRLRRLICDASNQL